MVRVFVNIFMPSKTEKQRKFFGAVMSAKKGGKASGKAKEAAKDMSKEQIKDFLKKEEVEVSFNDVVQSLLEDIETSDVLLEKKKAKKKDACYRKVKARYKVWPSAYACVPENISKALTKEGWKSVNELNINDDILTYNIKNDELEFKPIINIHRYKNAKTQVIRSGNTGFNFECTSNHKWVVKLSEAKSDVKRKYDRIDDKALITTEDIINYKSNKSLVVSATYNNKSAIKKDLIYKYGDNWIKYILEISPEQRQSWLFSAIVYDGNQRIIERLKENTENINPLDWKYTSTLNKQSFGFKQKDIMHRDAFLLSAFLNGGTVSWKKQKTEIYSCSYVSNKKYKNCSNFKIKEENITDVWCPETENGTWVMMQESERGGIITITGNSGALVKCRKKGAKNWGKSK
jgi:hypothetical protein